MGESERGRKGQTNPRAQDSVRAKQTLARDAARAGQSRPEQVRAEPSGVVGWSEAGQKLVPEVPEGQRLVRG